MKALVLFAVLSVCSGYTFFEEVPWTHHISKEPLITYSHQAVASNAIGGPVFRPPNLNPTSCPDPNWKYCTHEFNTDLGIPSDLDWNNVTDLWKEIDALYTSDVNSVLKICQARAKFYQCLGAAYDLCMNPWNFVRHNISLFDGYNYVATFKRMEFQCAGGNIQLTKNWACMWNVYNSPAYNNSQWNCLNTYLNQTANNTNSGSICSAGANYIHCMIAPFNANPCSQNVNEIRWFQCEMIRTSFQIEGFCPDLSCSTQIFGSVSAEIDIERHQLLQKQRNEFFEHLNDPARLARLRLTHASEF